MLFAGVLSILTVGGVDRVLAHPDIESAVALENEASFEEALAAFEAAWEASELTREELTQIAAHRALLRFALNDGGALVLDLEILAALAPDYDFPANVPPGIRTLFSAACARTTPPKVVVLPTHGAKTRLHVHVSGIPAELVRENRLYARPRGGEWSVTSDGELEVPTADGSVTEWYAEVVGPGGVTLWSEGRADQPKTLVLEKVAEARHAPAPIPNHADDNRSDDRRWRWWLVGSGAVVAMALSAVAIVAATRPSAQSTEISGPVIQ